MKAAIYDAQFLSSVGIEAVLKDRNDQYEVTILNTHHKLLPQLDKHTPDLLIFEYLGKYPVPAETIKLIQKGFPDMKMLIISEDDDTIEIKKRIAMGVHGFLTKKCSAQEVRMTIETINNGGRFYCQRIIEIMTDQDQALSVELTERELQIVRMISKGLSSTVMAETLNLSIHTINSHRKNILKKLGFKSPAELIAYAVKKMN